MTEGEVPEILKYLQEGLPSAGAYEQQVRREFQITGYARKLQIPQESLETNATVYRYVTVLRDADAARERLGRYETRTPIFAGDARAEERVAQASFLYAADKMILEEGFQARMHGGVDLPARPIDIDPIRGTASLTGLLDRAAQPFGLRVDVPQGWRERRRYEISRELATSYRPQPDPVAGLWTGAPFMMAGEEPWQREGDRSHEWYWPDWPNERHDPEHLLALAQEAKRCGIDPDRPRVDPAMHTVLTALVYGRQLVEETSGVEELVPAPGLTPSVHERLGRVAPVSRLAVTVLEDAVRPGSLALSRFTTELSAAVKPYGLIVTSRETG